MTVQQDYELRKTVRGAGGSYKVIKNNIADEGVEGSASKDVFGSLKGMTSIAWTTADPVALAKALTTMPKRTQRSRSRQDSSKAAR